MTEKIEPGSTALIRRCDGVLVETMVGSASKGWIVTGAGTFNRRTMRRLYSDDPIVFIGDQLGARKFMAEDAKK